MKKAEIAEVYRQYSKARTRWNETKKEAKAWAIENCPFQIGDHFQLKSGLHELCEISYHADVEDLFWVVNLKKVVSDKRRTRPEMRVIGPGHDFDLLIKALQEKKK